MSRLDLRQKSRQQQRLGVMGSRFKDLVKKIFGNDLVVFYCHEDETMSEMLDDSGHYNHGVYYTSGVAYRVPALVDDLDFAIAVDGSTGFAQATTDPTLFDFIHNDGVFTIAQCIIADDAVTIPTTQMPISSVAGSSDKGAGIWLSTAEEAVGYWVDGTTAHTVTLGTIPIEQPYWSILTGDGSNIYGGIDGVANGPTAITPVVGSAARIMTLGGSPTGGNRFDGLISVTIIARKTCSAAMAAALVAGVY